MFGIPNPLDLATDWFSDGANDVWVKLLDKVKDNPELVIIPTLVVAGALVVTAGSPAYSVAYMATAGALDAAEGREFGHVITGGILQ